MKTVYRVVSTDISIFVYFIFVYQRAVTSELFWALWCPKVVNYALGAVFSLQYKILHIFQIAAKLPKFAVELQTWLRGVAQRIRNDPKARYICVPT